MKFELEETILNETVKCRTNFSCLNGNEDCLCEVVHTIGDKLLFIKPAEGRTCDYMIPFGHSYFCKCPTRMEIHRLYSLNINDMTINSIESDK